MTLKSNDTEKNYKEKYCGNCNSHNVYHYPDTILCFKRYTEKKEPFIVPVFYSCDEWEQQLQECNCLKDASKK